MAKNTCDKMRDINTTDSGYNKDIQECTMNTMEKLSEFEVLKLSTKEFDKFKAYVKKLPIIDKAKTILIKQAEDIFYATNNYGKKLYFLKRLNEDMKKLEKYRSGDISLIKNDLKKIKSVDLLNNLSSGEKIVALVFLSSLRFLLATLLELSTIGIFLGYIGLVSFSGYSYFSNTKELIKKNKLFDMINDDFPHITKKEFDKIYLLYEKGKIDINYFLELVKKFESDGKITKEERELIDDFLKLN